MPALTNLNGSKMEIKDDAKDPAVRIAVMGRAEVKSGLNSVFGFFSLCFLKKNTMLASVNEKIYEIKTANPARIAP